MLVGVTVNEQLVPGWTTVNVRPAIVAVPVRWLDVVFRATAMETDPLPVLLAPFATVSHETLPAAVQLHVLPVVTLTVVFSPAAGDVREDGEIV
jgi:hypothetical protein